MAPSIRIGTRSRIWKRFRTGAAGDVEVTQKLATAINAQREPMREHRVLYDVPGLIEDRIWYGTQRAREETRQTLHEVHKAMGLAGMWNRLQRKAARYRATVA